ncbi:MAG TPA: phosphoribosylformylglycinamidine synthase subunit PurL [Bacteroidota bacterium]|nr:phosphoribosylformylglycinamidine synthase subunit PurL [Bacteroidota bacterium]
MDQVLAYSEPSVTLSLALEHGLTEEEYSRICEVLGRTPTYTELGIYSVMWSEHCSYKNSIAVIKKLPRSGGRLLVAGGEENAGLVDIGDGLAVAFKIESHNHPSAVEPYQGAATGVGGILRDIFTMGARPIAALNSLRFGNLSDDRVKNLFKRVVKGIGDYGNSFGVPTVAGEIYFDDCYATNPLVNAMAVGIVRVGEIARAIAKGPGNVVMIVGSSTGKDGIHGATFASEEISSESEARRPSVQVGDPFTEKLLLEATLEAIHAGLIVGIQDMGAAGLTCSSSEMSAKGGVGMRIDVSRVPLREERMTPYEIMLSESQERMLLVVKSEHVEEVRKIFSKWDLNAVVIGSVTEEPNLLVMEGDRVVADVPASSLVLGGGAPVYERDAKRPAYVDVAQSFDVDSVPVPSDLSATLLSLLARPTIASKRFVWEQYDWMVRTNTVATEAGDAAVVRIKGTAKALALSTDCNARYVYLDPKKGGEIAVAESARNVVCVGAKPLAITNCLNFGNPYDPEVFWQFKEAVAGIGEACRVLGTPVTGGNVSFYNEGPTGAVYPTPVIGMLGLIEDVSKVLGSRFRTAGDVIVLFGKHCTELGASEYLLMSTDRLVGGVPDLELEYEQRLQACVLEAISSDYLRSAHDVSEGGLAVALAESCFSNDDRIGCVVYTDSFPNARPDAVLFGEGQSRIIASLPEKDVPLVMGLAQKWEIDARVIGIVTNTGRLIIGSLVDVGVSIAKSNYEMAIERQLGRGEGEPT